MEHTHTYYNRPIQYNKWMPVYAHKSEDVELTKCEGYEIMLLNEPIGYKIRSFIKNDNGIEFKENTKRVHLYNDDYNILHVIVGSAFPDIKPLSSVDHINSDWKDNNIANLRWLTIAENAARANEGVHIENRTGMEIEMICPDTKNVIKRFKSVQMAARFIIEKRDSGDEDTVAAKIREYIKGRRTTKTYGFYWKQSDINNADDEEWKPLKIGCKTIEVSNKGRFKNSFGHINECTNSRDTKHRQFSCITEEGSQKLETIYLHRAIWMAFHQNEPIPEDMCIFHDPNAPLDKDGKYRNWLCDLRIGTQTDANQARKEQLEKPQPVQVQPPNIPEINDEDIVIPERRYNEETVVTHFPQYNATVLTKNDNSNIFDTTFVPIVQRYTIDGTRISVNKHKIQLTTFVWTQIKNMPVPIGSCIKPINGFTNDLRIENLEVFNGDPKSVQLPRNPFLTEKQKKLLGVENLPRYCFVNASRFNISGIVKRTLDKAFSTVAISKDRLDNYIIPLLRKWYSDNNHIPDYDTDNVRYSNLYKSYVDIIKPTIVEE